MRGALLRRLCSVALIAVASFAFAGSGRAQSPTLEQREQKELEQIRALKKTLITYRDCVLAATERYATRTTEPAATVVEVAIGACGNERSEYIKASLAFGASNAQEVLDMVRPLATKQVLDVRSC